MICCVASCILCKFSRPTHSLIPCLLPSPQSMIIYPWTIEASFAADSRQLLILWPSSNQEVSCACPPLAPERALWLLGPTEHNRSGAAPVFRPSFKKPAASTSWNWDCFLLELWTSWKEVQLPWSHQAEDDTCRCCCHRPSWAQPSSTHPSGQQTCEGRSTLEVDPPALLPRQMPHCSVTNCPAKPFPNSWLKYH